MRRAETTLDDEVKRHDRLIELLARRPAVSRLQARLDAAAELWAAPAHRHRCLGGHVHWRVQPSSEAVKTVAAHHGDERAGVRRAVLVALRHASPHASEAFSAVASGLADPDPLNRVQAARAAYWLELGVELTEPLAQRLDDPLWTVRWVAAAALAGTSLRARATEVLSRCAPSRNHLTFDRWLDCAEVLGLVSAPPSPPSVP